MPASDLIVLLAAAAAVLAAGAGFLLRRGVPAPRAARMAIAAGTVSLVLLAGAVALLARAGAHDDTRQRLARAQAALDAHEARIGDIAEGLRTELQSRDDHRTRQDQELARIAHDLHGAQVAAVELRRMLAGIDGTSGLLITRDGRFAIDAGGARFEPCGWGESWRVEFGPGEGARDRLVTLLGGKREALVAFTGVLSSRGRFGPAGEYPHLFVVVDGEPTERTDCG